MQSQRLGQVLDARVIGFREVDRTLNLSSNHVRLKCWKMMPR